MAVTLYKEVSYTLSYLLQDIEKGDLALPDLQRPFVWATAKIRELLDSMYRGYPIGSLMFWETGAEVGSHQIGIGEVNRTGFPGGFRAQVAHLTEGSEDSSSAQH